MEASQALDLFNGANKLKVPINQARILLYLKINPESFQKTMVIDGLLSRVTLSQTMAILIASGKVIQTGPHKDKKHSLGPKGEILVEKLLKYKQDEPT